MSIRDWKFKVFGQPFRGGDGGGGGGGEPGAPDPGQADPSGASSGGYGGGGAPAGTGGSGQPAEVASGTPGAAAPAAPAASDTTSAPAAPGGDSLAGGNGAQVGPAGPSTGSSGGFSLAELAGTSPSTAPASSPEEDADKAAGLNPNTPTIDTTVSPKDMMDAMVDPGKVASDGKPSQPGFATNGVSLGMLGAIQDQGGGKLSVSDNQTVDQALAASNVNAAMPTIAGLVMGQIPGAGLAVNVGKNVAAAIDGTLSPTQAATNVIGGLLAGQINQAVMGALPSDVASGISGLNQASAIGGLLGVDLPSVNPGRSVVDAVLGSNTTPSSSGPVNSAGGTIDQSAGLPVGGSNAGDTSSTEAPTTPAAPAAPAAPVGGAEGTNMRFNLKNAAAMGRAIRAGAMARRH